MLYTLLMNTLAGGSQPDSDMEPLIDMIDALFGPTDDMPWYPRFYDPQTEGIVYLMAEKPQNTSESNLNLLAKQLEECRTVSDLFKLASSDAFKAGALSLSEADVKSLRGVYHAQQQKLDGQVKMADIDGQTVNIVGIEWWQSDYGDGVTLTFTTDREPDKKLKARTSSAPVVQFTTRLREVPSDKEPVRALFQQVPVSDPERAKQGQKKWQVRRLPPANRGMDGGVPF